MNYLREELNDPLSAVIMTGVPQHMLQVNPKHLRLNRNRNGQSSKYFEPITLISVPPLHH